MNKYESIPFQTKDEAIAVLDKAQSTEELCVLLLGLCEIEDWEWVQEQYLKYIHDEDKWVSSSAITGLGHLARINGNLDKKRVITTLEQLAQNRPELEGKISDALSDIDIYL
ncbi:hypothetical protein [Vibrio spartinae]|uniref:HEAT repeat domain-containing protein n=1 Tax=Vibrio spartinae TaxID=1918945 RepID=A0ABX6R5T1_9VIBR|nr:hypothetical protein [Vibrio spartinae]QMV16763.1 hypothetical protein Vspart_04169 [Vibrio spartinae]